MPPGFAKKAAADPNDDDYVAQVLSMEARSSSLKYSSLGMEAYVPKRPTGAAPKPNTRFLRHIIKETDNHNAALKKKEEREARERMRQLRNPPSSSHRSSKDHRSRQSNTSDSRDSRRERRDDRDDRHRSHRRRPRSRSPSTERERSCTSRRRHDSRDRDDDQHRRSRKSHRRRSYSRSRSRSPQNEKGKNSRRHRQHRRRSSSPRSRSRSPEKRKSRDIRKLSPPPSTSAFRNEESGDESDPLEDLVGPLPAKEAPVRSRGRGAYKPNSSNIDAHFAADYDPTLDVQPEDDDIQSGSRLTRRAVAGLMTGDDDWEVALEALRDRTRWKQKGEERLREAGFNNDIVERWKNSSSAAPAGDSEGSLENVKWSKKGEGREWDRGKFIDDDGHIDVKASW
ncbi:hypothetical protein P175DRAFT_0556815 [Aspergillus ochraceoroseus IBT 24754]|uniref:Pre-mRNA-splicing factor 38B n=2 Tax=Aspergillus ochraceoroseus TaxID=138278 RepID=A0A2T5M008_9EURO|nr:uncharacterized protein P175DRAFT_0556815 [Aspergillus ochraceoroseus IBT 24754]KKK24192.1 hypothetical protein AOCH_000781 [Aspergillus ochraceoroseus]PTU21862.1 hypothetical protein P175DRAFT_0556815 [Aspergillus ochraceoroseus IBT 24754]